MSWIEAKRIRSFANSINILALSGRLRRICKTTCKPRNASRNILLNIRKRLAVSIKIHYSIIPRTMWNIILDGRLKWLNVCFIGRIKKSSSSHTTTPIPNSKLIVSATTTRLVNIPSGSNFPFSKNKLQLFRLLVYILQYFLSNLASNFKIWL